MKLIFDECTASFEVEEFFNEATGINSKKYKIKGIFSTPGQKNKNGRVYPMSIWENQVAKYQDELKNGTSNCLMELNHPSRTNVDMMEAVAKIEKLYIKDNYVMGEAFLLNNPKANQLKSLIDAGITMSVSSRGVGKLGHGNIVESFALITFDIIPDQGQSDYNAKMKGIVEGVLEDKEFIITESGSIEEVKVCTSDACHLFEKKDIQSALKDKFAEFLSEMVNVKKLPDHSNFEKSGFKVKGTFSRIDKMTKQRKLESLFFNSKEAAKKYAELKGLEVEAVKDMS